MGSLQVAISNFSLSDICLFSSLRWTIIETHGFRVLEIFRALDIFRVLDILHNCKFHTNNDIFMSPFLSPAKKKSSPTENLDLTTEAKKHQ